MMAVRFGAQDLRRLMNTFAMLNRKQTVQVSDL